MATSAHLNIPEGHRFESVTALVQILATQFLLV